MKRKPLIIFFVLFLAGILFLWHYGLYAEKNDTVAPVQIDQISDQEKENKLPIVYSENYNITFLGIEQLHPFDSTKYRTIYKALIDAGIAKESFFTPEKVTDAQLLTVHTQEYLDSLKYSSVVARIAEMGVLSLLPGKMVDNRILNPMRYATGGTILGAELALEYGWAINLSGGYHHAKADEGGGFNAYSDIAIAIEHVWKTHPKYTVLIIDLDTHQGNGYASIFTNDPRIFIFDLYNADIYPHDTDAKQYIDFDYGVSSGITDEEYLQILKTNLPTAIDQSNPDLIIYNAGTDIYENDLLVNMKITREGIVERDAFVFTQAEGKNIPILMLLSGGYGAESAGIISDSVVGIFESKR